MCGLTSKTKKDLNRHIERVHEKNNRFRCEICDTSFFNSAHLKRHLDVHGNTRPHNCNICDAKFKRKEHLGTHLKTKHDLGK